jgi:hypothetical protein
MLNSDGLVHSQRWTGRVIVMGDDATDRALLIIATKACERS